MHMRMKNRKKVKMNKKREWKRKWEGVSKDEKGKKEGMMYKIPETETKYVEEDKGELKIIIIEEGRAKEKEKWKKRARKEKRK